MNKFLNKVIACMLSASMLVSLAGCSLTENVTDKTTETDNAGSSMDAVTARPGTSLAGCALTENATVDGAGTNSENGLISVWGAFPGYLYQDDVLQQDILDGTVETVAMNYGKPLYPAWYAIYDTTRYSCTDEAHYEEERSGYVDANKAENWMSWMYDEWWVVYNNISGDAKDHGFTKTYSTEYYYLLGTENASCDDVNITVESTIYDFTPGHYYIATNVIDTSGIDTEIVDAFCTDLNSGYLRTDLKQYPTCFTIQPHPMSTELRTLGEGQTWNDIFDWYVAHYDLVWHKVIVDPQGY